LLRVTINLLSTFIKISIPCNLIGEQLGYANECFPLIAPFAISNGFVFNLAEEVNVLELSLSNAGAYLSSLEIGEEPPPEEFLELAVANIDGNKGFEVFIVSLYLHFPTLVPVECVNHIIELFPQQMFTYNLFKQLRCLVMKEDTDPNIKVEIVKKFLVLLLFNRVKLKEMSITRNIIEESIHQFNEELVEASISQLTEYADIIRAMLSKQ
jgi:hypothetical protein